MQAANLMAILGLVCVGLAVSAAVLLVSSFVATGLAAWLITAFVLVMFGGLWFAFPLTAAGDTGCLPPDLRDSPSCARRRRGTTAAYGRQPAMGQIASEALIERLAAWGVDTVFGLPGDGINGLMEGLRRHQDKVRFVLVHHEEAAAFMATGVREGHRPDRRVPGHLGPGGIHLLNGLYDAKLDHSPCSPSPACRRPRCWAPGTSRRSTWTSCTPTWPSTTR